MSKVHVNYKTRGNIEVTSASVPYSIWIQAKLALVTEKYIYNSDYLSTLEWLGNEFRGVNRDLDRGTKARYYDNTVADR